MGTGNGVLLWSDWERAWHYVIVTVRGSLVHSMVRGQQTSM